MIVEMYGHCDTFDVVYTCIEPGLWQATVPADLTDGKYVVDIYGVDSTGYIVYWTGILYMWDSRVISLEILPESCITFYDTSDEVQVFESFADTRIMFSSSLMGAKEVCTMGCSGLPSIKFTLGEKKYVWFKVVSKVEQLFTITDATWELKRAGEIIAAGACEIDGTDTVRLLLEPPAYGAYTLYISYTVPPEIKKAQVNVLVS